MMIKLCGYACEHNKGGVCQTTMCDKKIVMTTTTNEPFEKRFNVKYDEQGVEKFTHWLDPTIEELKHKIKVNEKSRRKMQQSLMKEIDRLNNIINELEKWLEDECQFDAYQEISYRETMEYVLAKLKELKGEDTK